MMSNKTLVLGIGNPIMQDDGIGVYVVQRLQAAPHPFDCVEFMDGGTLSFSLIGEIEAADNLIVIDAAQLNEKPGSVQVFLDDEMDRFLGSQKNSSVHDVTLIDLMSIALLSDRLPARRALFGVQPGCVELGLELTDDVRNAIPNVCNLTLELLQSWRSSIN